MIAAARLGIHFCSGSSGLQQWQGNSQSHLSGMSTKRSVMEEGLIMKDTQGALNRIADRLESLKTWSEIHAR